MIEALGYLWLRPVWWGLIPAALVLGVVMVRRSGHLGAWEHAVDPEVLSALRKMGRVAPGGTMRQILPACVLGALAIALAGPAVERRENVGYRNLDAVVLVLDLSPSVTNGTRLFDALTSARLVAEAAGTRQTALVIFAGEAYLAAPFSTDARALSDTLSLLDAKTMPVTGSRPEAALALARKILESSEILAADIVFFSDGEALTPAALGEAMALNARGWPVSTLHVPGDDPAGAGALSALATAGGGVLADLDDPFPVVRKVVNRPIERLAASGYAMLVLDDFGRYLLFLALIPAFLMLPRGGRT